MKKSNPKKTLGRNITSRFVEIQMKELEGKPLSENELAFLEKLESYAQLFPEEFSKAILLNDLPDIDFSDTNSEIDVPIQALKSVRAADERIDLSQEKEHGKEREITTHYRRYRAAADTLTNLHDEVMAIWEKGEKLFVITIRTEEIPIFKIESATLLRPIHNEGYTFKIDRGDGNFQEVDMFGGFGGIGVEALKELELKIDEQNKVILLQPKPE